MGLYNHKKKMFNILFGSIRISSKKVFNILWVVQSPNDVNPEQAK